QPIVVTADCRLLAGYRRLEACRRLGWTDVPVRIVDLDDLLRAECDENVVRKDFTPSEAVAVARALEASERERTEANQGTRTDRLGGKLPPSSAGKTRDRVATRVGMSGRTLEKARAVVDAAERQPSRYQSLVEEMDRTGKVDAAYRRLKEAEEPAA